MPTSTSTFVTENGQKYLTQLVKHFAHKIDAAADGGEGYANFVCGKAKFFADELGLRMDIDSPDQAALEKTQEIVEVHLVRFAFREKLEKLDWA